jgi:hypothetical protein
MASYIKFVTSLYAFMTTKLNKTPSRWPRKFYEESYFLLQIIPKQGLPLLQTGEIHNWHFPW